MANPELFPDGERNIIRQLDTSSLLATWYGPDAIACHTLKFYDDDTVEAEFIVGETICGPNTRPPMFDRLVSQDGVYTTQTDQADAHDHFNEHVGLQVVPGHNIAGLLVETGRQAISPDATKQPSYYLVGYDYIRFKSIVLPGQQFSFSGNMSFDETGVTFSATLPGQRRPFAGGFRVEMGEPVDKDKSQFILDQHWLLEINAQALGVLALANDPRHDIAPIYLESGPTTFAKVPIKSGDLLRTKLTVLSADDDLILGNAVTYNNGIEVINQQELLLGVTPIEDLRKLIGAQN